MGIETLLEPYRQLVGPVRSDRSKDSKKTVEKVGWVVSLDKMNFKSPQNSLLKCYWMLGCSTTPKPLERNNSSRTIGFKLWKQSSLGGFRKVMEMLNPMPMYDGFFRLWGSRWRWEMGTALFGELIKGHIALRCSTMFQIALASLQLIQNLLCLSKMTHEVDGTSTAQCFTHLQLL